MLLRCFVCVIAITLTQTCDSHVSYITFAAIWCCFALVACQNPRLGLPDTCAGYLLKWMAVTQMLSVYVLLFFDKAQLHNSSFQMGHVHPSALSRCMSDLKSSFYMGKPLLLAKQHSLIAMQADANKVIPFS